MDSILLDLINSLLEGAGELINLGFMSSLQNVFYPEADFPLLSFDGLFRVVLEFALAFIVLKFIKKGFDIYIGWYEGDKDNSPFALLINFARAIIMALVFTPLYGLLVGVAEEFLSSVLSALVGMELVSSWLDFILKMIDTVVSGGLFTAISALIFVIGWIALFIKWHVLGVEMFILRVGFPIACIGLLDSDKGVFAPIVKEMFKITLTAIVQIFLMRLSMVAVGDQHLIWGAAFLMGAFKLPKTLTNFIYAYGGGGNLAMKVSSTMHVGMQLKQILNAAKSAV